MADNKKQRDEQLDEAVEETFPASDPIAVPTKPTDSDTSRPIPKGKPVPGAPKTPD